MTSKAQARRNRKTRGAMPALAPVKRQEPRGRAHQERNKQKAKKPNLSARCRIMGLEDNKQNRERVDIPRLTWQQGMVIEVMRPKEAASLWQTYADMHDAVAKHRSRNLGVSEHAKSTKHEFMPDRLEVSGSDTIDTRSPEEKDVAAERAYKIWQGHLKALTENDRKSLAGAWGQELLIEGKPTPQGVAFVGAVWRLWELVK